MLPQWPSSAETRRKCAAYICERLCINPYGPLLQIFEAPGGHDIRPRNGMICIGTINVPESIVKSRDPTPWLSGELVYAQNLVALALHCCTFFNQTNCTSWVREETLKYPNAILPRAIWEQLSFTQLCYSSANTIFQVGRPDIANWCRIAYYNWLEQCRCPKAIHAALTTMADSTWQLSAPSTAASEFLELVKALQVCVVRTSARGQSDVIINKRGALSLAPRDKLLLSLFILRGENIPMLRDKLMPSVCLAVPVAFQTSQQGAHLLDEVQIKG